jgi:hypothetical protein
MFLMFNLLEHKALFSFVILLVLTSSPALGYLVDAQEEDEEEQEG